MGLFGKGRQRMGQGIRGCLNINNWNHLFSPNSQSALNGAEACLDYWGRLGTGPEIIFDGDYTVERSAGGSSKTAPTRVKVALGLERYAKPDMVVDKDAADLIDARNLVGPPDFSPLVVAAVVVVIAYLIWK